MTTELVQWLRSCVGKKYELSPTIGKTSTWAGDEVLPDLPKPFKYRKRANAISIYRDFEDAQGRNRTIQKPLCKADDLQHGREYFESLIPTLVEDIMEKVKEATSECSES